MDSAAPSRPRVIAVGCDHAGYPLKPALLEHLAARGWEAKDVGTYSITRDPEEGWLNAGAYRAQVHDKKTVGFLIAKGHHGWIHREKYWKKGEPMPAVMVLGGDPITLDAHSVCVHSDTPGAVEMARHIRSRLLAAGVAIGPFLAA